MNRGNYSEVEDEDNLHEYTPEDEYGGESDFEHDALSVIGVISVNHHNKPVEMLGLLLRIYTDFKLSSSLKVLFCSFVHWAVIWCPTTTSDSY